MLRRKTLFVIGAGTGDGIEMPLGAGLSNTIVNYVGFEHLVPNHPGANEARTSIKRAASERQINEAEIINVGRRMATRVGRFGSIDRYVDAHQEDDLIKIVSKIAIFHAILMAEHASALSPLDDGGFKNARLVHSSWLERFWFLLNDGHRAPAIDKIFENLMIINFNYDRVIEHYLLTTLKQLYDRPDGYFEKLVRERLIIEHPYGSIGKLSWQEGEPKIHFGTGEYVGDALKISNEIRTFSEQVADAATVERMQKMVSNAQQIIFLGFHFHDPNVALMTIPAGTNSGDVSIYATTFGRASPAKFIIERQINTMLGGRVIRDATSIHGNLNCNDLFSQYLEVMAS